jgi:hypothetical protein
MNTSALILMISTMSAVVAVTGYFFYRVLTTPPKPDNGERPEGFYEAD